MSMDSFGKTVYDIHGLLKISVVGSDHSIGRILDSTLGFFRVDSTKDESDLNVVLGQYPSPDWILTGYIVGDRTIYDPTSEYLIVFRNALSRRVNYKDIEFIIKGDIRKSLQPVYVYVPNISSDKGRLEVFIELMLRLRSVRAFLTALGDDAALHEQVERDTARLRLAILEPFLYYRLPKANASLVHASVASRNGKGIMFAGSGHVGKTTMILQLLKIGFSYLAEDLAIINDEGKVLSYPEPIRIEPQHLRSFSIPSDKIYKSNSINNFLFSALIKHYPDELLQYRPMVPVSQLFGHERVIERCDVSKILILKRGNFKNPQTRILDAEVSGNVLSAELFWEFEARNWRHNQYLFWPAEAKDEDYLEQEKIHRKTIRRILHSAASKCECLLVEIPNSWNSIELLNLLKPKLVEIF